MKIYNSLTLQKEEFVPVKEGQVSIYCCGPTVYNRFHIGNARCFVVFDTLRRYFSWLGYDVRYVQNFTDVDDKMIKRANEEGVTVAEIAERYINEYFIDAKGLNLKPATVHPRATQHMDEIIAMVQTLIDKGYAYEAEGDVYFQPSLFAEYGKLCHQPLEDLELGARIDVTDVKRHPEDFALWKAWKPGEPSWDSPWGKGRPGWHIECSAMSTSLLGKTIDIHCGGQDLTFPHHENEIAQSECANGCTFARYWMHNGYINVDSRKMSKSLGNFFMVRDVAEQYGYMPIRFFLLASHYRSPVNYTGEVIEQAVAALNRIRNCRGNLAFAISSAAAGEGSAEGLQVYRQRFADALADDFNTADAIAAVFELVSEINRLLPAGGATFASQALPLLDELLEVLGFDLVEKQDDEEAQKIEELLAERAQARKERNYARADEIRNQLTEMGIVIEDTPNGAKWSRKA